MPNHLVFLPCLDSNEMASTRQRELDILPDAARKLAQSAVAISRAGTYLGPGGEPVSIDADAKAACANKLSIPPDAPLPDRESTPFPETRIQVTNETTLGASWRLMEGGFRPLALNFANGIRPGGGFLNGACAQEEALCRSSALYQTLVGDPMYKAHAGNSHRNSSDWAILSPDVPVFRNDDGTLPARPWLLSFITCAAPSCKHSSEYTADLLKQRIHRVLGIAKAYQYDTLVLGAWGCGAFNNDPVRTAADFRAALETEYRGAFSDVVFAITDWSPERKYLGPFRDAFSQ